MTEITAFDIRLLDRDLVERVLRDAIEPSLRLRELEWLSTFPPRIVLSADLVGGTSLIVKLAPEDEPHAFDAEAYQLNYLEERGLLHVPRVLRNLSESELGGRPCLILERLPGLEWGSTSSFLRTSDAASLERELGEMIGRLHCEEAPAFGEVLPGSTPSFHTWPQFYGRWWQKRIDDLLCTDRLTAPTRDAVSWIHSNLSLLLASSETPRLIHGALNASSVLCAGPERGARPWRVSGVLHPALAYGHPELDLAHLETHLGVGRSFFDAYRAHRTTDLGYARRKRVYFLYAALDKVRVHGQTQDILHAMDLVRQILRDS
jgi:fructosamine-3-kinase